MATRADLWNAIECGHAKSVLRCLRKRPDLLETTDEHGFTPLMRAVSCCTRTISVIDAILDGGAAVNRQTDEGYTALHCAIDVNGEANDNTDEVIGRLIAAGADLTLRQHYGWTPLLRAVVEGTAAEVKALLAGGANANDEMPLRTLPAFNAGRTALMAAITNPHAEEMVEALLNAGADPRRRDKHGMTFFDYVEVIVRETGEGEFTAQVERCADIVRSHINTLHS